MQTDHHECNYTGPPYFPASTFGRTARVSGFGEVVHRNDEMNCHCGVHMWTSQCTFAVRTIALVGHVTPGQTPPLLTRQFPMTPLGRAHKLLTFILRLSLSGGKVLPSLLSIRYTYLSDSDGQNHLTKTTTTFGNSWYRPTFAVFFHRVNHINNGLAVVMQQLRTLLVVQGRTTRSILHTPAGHAAWYDTTHQKRARDNDALL